MASTASDSLMRAASSSKGAANVPSENARASFQRSIAGKIGSVSVAANAIAGTASAAALPALAVPAIAFAATDTDPIFPAIERWKEALAFSDGTFAAPLEEEAALIKESDAVDAIFQTVPTTSA